MREDCRLFVDSSYRHILPVNTSLVSCLPSNTSMSQGLAKHSDIGHYSQIVVIGNMAKLSGQGGWDETGELSKYDWQQQIDNAFDNVERVLKAAGLRGWEDVSLT
jgi:enamine deaminase RidA (YjgF/YER057c/UK114 family)